MIGFLTVLQKVSDVWEKQPDRLQQDAKTLTRLVKQQLEGRSLIDVEPVDISIVQRVRDNLSSEFDKEYGGFGYNLSNPNRPKFPEPSNLFFLHGNKISCVVLKIMSLVEMLEHGTFGVELELEVQLLGVF